MDWRLLTFMVCTFGFFKDLRPSEAYLTPYLTGPRMNLTETEVNNEVYPWWTYSYLLWLVPVFLLTDYLRYKPILVLNGVAYITTCGLLLWAKGLPAMKLMQVSFGLATACEIGYYSYLYAIISKDRFTQVSSLIRAASQISKFVAYLLGQLFLSYQVCTIYGLNIFSAVSVCIAFTITLTLPRAQHSELFNPQTNNVTDTLPPTSEKMDHSEPEDDSAPDVQEASGCKMKNIYSLQRIFKIAINEIRSIYSSKTVALWSLWWAFATCGNFQVGNYIQNIWKEIAPHRTDRHLYNGAVDAAGTLLSSISVLFVGFLPVDWSVYGRAELLIALVCALNAVLLVFVGRTSEIWVAYIFSDIFRATYQMVVTIAAAQIARNIARERYGLVFGCNTFVALVIESILTAVVVDKAGLGVDVRTQFVVYGGYFAVMAIAFSVIATRTMYTTGCCHRHTQPHSRFNDDLELREV